MFTLESKLISDKKMHIYQHCYVLIASLLVCYSSTTFLIVAFLFGLIASWIHYSQSTVKHIQYSHIPYPFLIQCILFPICPVIDFFSFFFFAYDLLILKLSLHFTAHCGYTIDITIVKSHRENTWMEQAHRNIIQLMCWDVKWFNFEFNWNIFP